MLINTKLYDPNRPFYSVLVSLPWQRPMQNFTLIKSVVFEKYAAKCGKTTKNININPNSNKIMHLSVTILFSTLLLYLTNFCEKFQLTTISRFWEIADVKQKSIFERILWLKINAVQPYLAKWVGDFFDILFWKHFSILLSLHYDASLKKNKVKNLTLKLLLKTSKISWWSLMRI